MLCSPAAARTATPCPECSLSGQPAPRTAPARDCPHHSGLPPPGTCSLLAQVPVLPNKNFSQWSRGESNPRVETVKTWPLRAYPMIYIQSAALPRQDYRVPSARCILPSLPGAPREGQPADCIACHSGRVTRNVLANLVRQQERSCYWQLYFACFFTWPACSTARHQIYHTLDRNHIGPEQT